MNFGNTCFVNAVVQLLSNTPELRRYFLHDNKTYMKQLARVSALKGRPARVLDPQCSKQRVELCIHFGAVLTALWNGSYKHVSAVDFLVRDDAK